MAPTFAPSSRRCYAHTMSEARRRIARGAFRLCVLVPGAVVLAWLLLWPTNSGTPVLILVVGGIVGAIWGGVEIAGGVRELRATRGNLPPARIVK